MPQTSPLLISTHSPGFQVFTSPSAVTSDTHTPVLKGFRKGASLFSGLLKPEGPQQMQRLKMLREGSFSGKRQPLPSQQKHTTIDELSRQMILSRLVDTFISRISLTMLPVPNPHNTVCVLSGEEARHWQSRSSGYSSS